MGNFLLKILQSITYLTVILCTGNKKIKGTGKMENFSQKFSCLGRIRPYQQG